MHVHCHHHRYIIVVQVRWRPAVYHSRKVESVSFVSQTTAVVIGKFIEIAIYWRSVHIKYKKIFYWLNLLSLRVFAVFAKAFAVVKASSHYNNSSFCTCGFIPINAFRIRFFFNILLIFLNLSKIISLQGGLTKQNWKKEFDLLLPWSIGEWIVATFLSASIDHRTFIVRSNNDLFALDDFDGYDENWKMIER